MTTNELQTLTYAQFQSNSLWIDLNDFPRRRWAAEWWTAPTVTWTATAATIMAITSATCFAVFAVRAARWRTCRNGSTRSRRTTANCGRTFGTWQLLVFVHTEFIVGIPCIFFGTAANESGQTWLEATRLIAKIGLHAPCAILCLNTIVTRRFAYAWILC